MKNPTLIVFMLLALSSTACLDYVTNFNCRTSADCEDSGLCVQSKCVVRSGQQVSVSITEGSVSVIKGTAVQLAATVTGVNEPRVTWSVRESTGGTVSSSGLYMAPASPGTYHVLATSVADVSKFATATVTVPPVAVVIANPPPAGTSIEAGTNYQFTAQVTGATDTEVTWSVQEGSSGGAVDASGLYTAPVVAGTWTVVATSVDDPTKRGSAQINVRPPPACAISVSPSAATVPGLRTQQFTATVSGPANKSVIWSVQEGASGGAVSAAGLYTAPVVGGTYHVVAACEVEVTATALATVTVPAVTVTITQSASGQILQVPQGGTFSFSASVTGALDTSVTWSVTAEGGAITADGMYTAPQGPLAANTYAVKATSVADPGQSATAAVKVPAVIVAVSPNSATVSAAASKSFTASVSGAIDTSVTWSVLEAGGGSVTSAGVYTAPIAGGTYHVVATSTVDPTNPGQVVVTVPPIQVTISPATQMTPLTVLQGDSFRFSAAVTASNQAVTWSVQEAGGGIIATDGTYTAPSGPAAAAPYHVRATSVLDPSKFDIAAVLVPQVGVAVTPMGSTVAEGDTQAFSATVTGSLIKSVVWSVQEGAAGGSITSSGLYTAPTAGGTYHVVATSTVDGTRPGSTAVTVPRVVVVISPATQGPPQQVLQGGTFKFSAAVTGAKITTVTWSVSEGASGGTVASDGTYTAPTGALAPGPYHVIATSVFDPTSSDSVTVQVPTVSVLVTPTPKTVVQGGSCQFTAAVSGAANTAVRWQVQEAAGGSVASDGTYLAPAGAGASGTYHVMATSVADPTKSDLATITVPVVGVMIPAGDQTVLQGGTFQFSASVTGAANTGVTWSVSAGGGTISASGNYTAPAGSSAHGTYTVTATSVVDIGKSASVSVTVPVVSVSVSPSAASVTAGFSQAFTATVTGAADTSVIWTVQEANGGAVNASGLYTAPGAGGTYHVVATSNVDTGKSGSAVVTVPAVGVAIDQPSQMVVEGGTFRFSATVTNAKDTSVNWSVLEAGGGSVASDGTYTAPAGSSAAGLYHVVATSNSDPTRSASVAVTVPVVGVSIAQGAQSLVQGGSLKFSALVTGAANTGVTWAVVQSGGGTIAPDGTYTAPAGSSAPGMYTVKATSAADNSKSASVSVTVQAIVVSVSPPTPTVTAGFTQNLTATVIGAADTSVTWSVQESSGGAVTSGGIYTAPGVGGTYHVTATSKIDTSKSGSATVTVPAVTIVIDQAAQVVVQGGSFKFSATVTNAKNTSVSWSLMEGVAGGTVTSDGTYTAPTGSSAAGTYHVVATSQSDPGQSASASLTIPMVAVAVSPASPSVIAGFTQNFTATVTGATNASATWSVQEAGGGIVSLAGLYTAPGVGGTYHVIATSTVDPSKSNLATVTVPQVGIKIDQPPQMVVEGGTFRFSATATNAKDTSVTWSVQEGAPGGQAALDGTYTAPAGSSAAGTYHVVATSNSDPTQSASVAVTVPAVTIAVSPPSATLAVGGTVPFATSVTGAANTSVTWSAPDSGGGSVTTSGTYTAPSAGGIFHVTAASVVDPTKAASAQVIVTQPEAPPSVPSYVSVVAPANATAAINVPVTDPNNLLPISSDIASVLIDLTAVGGSSTQAITTSASQTTQTALYTYNLPTAGLSTGTYQLTYTAIDNTGATASGVAAVTVYTGAERDVGPGQTYATIQAGIGAAVAGDLVLVHDGTYSGAGNTNLTLGGKLIVVASQNGPAVTIIDCKGSGRGFNFQASGEPSGTTITGFTITNAAASAIRIVATTTDPVTIPTLTNSIISNSSAAALAGGLGLDGSNASSTIIGVTFSSNTAGTGAFASALGASNGATTLVQSCQFAGNGLTAVTIPVVHMSQDANIDRSIFATSLPNDTVDAEVGLTLRRSMFSSNNFVNSNSEVSAGRSGSGQTTIEYTTFHSGNALGAGISVTGNNLVVTHVSVDGYNEGIYDGTSQSTITDVTVSNCPDTGIRYVGGSPLLLTRAVLSNNGSAIYGYGDVTIDQSTLASNVNAIASINNSYLAVSVSNSVFTNNRAGAVLLNGFSGGAVVASNVTFTNNGGNAVSVNGPAAVSNSVFRGNTGYSVFSVGAMTVSNCLFENNPGGALYNGSAATVQNSSFLGNSKFGAIYTLKGSSTIVKNSVLWGNSVGSNAQDLYVDQTGGATTVVSVDNSDIGVVYDPGIVANSGNGFIPGVRGNLSTDPIFVTGPKGDAYLSQIAAGQAAQSACVDSGLGTAASLLLDTLTTRTDGVTDTGVVDMGYHYLP